MNQNIEAFLKVLDPSDSSTGGGTASAVAGAMAAGMVGMVARLSIGKKGMKEEAFYRRIASEAERLSRDLFAGGRMDSQAFEHVSAAYKLPKQTDEEKAERSARIQEAMIHAAKVPLGNAENCARVLALHDDLSDAFNANAASDLACARYLAAAGVAGCLQNVDINLPHIKDAQVVAGLRAGAGMLRARAPRISHETI